MTITPAERVRLIGDTLGEAGIAAARAGHDGLALTLRNRSRSWIALSTEAAQARVASVDEAPSLPSIAPSSDTPESPPPGGESGGRPTVTVTNTRALNYWGEVVLKSEHDRLVSWLDDDRAKLTERAEKAEAAAAVLRQALEAFGGLYCLTCPNLLASTPCDNKTRCQHKSVALAAGAGAKLLAEVEKLRAFVRAFDAFDEASTNEWDSMAIARAAINGS